MIDQHTLGSLFAFAIVASFVVVPVALVVGFLAFRASSRRARIRGPWGALAAKLGGELFEGSGLRGSSLVAHRPTHSIEVRMTVVSVAEAMGVPYYPDGGTFTEIVAQLPWQGPALFVPQGTKTQTFVDKARVPSLSALGPQAEIFVDPKAARIVVPGLVEDVVRLEASARALEELTGLVLHAGPLPPAAA